MIIIMLCSVVANLLFCLRIKERICNECHLDMSLLLDTTVSSATDGESDTETYSDEPVLANNGETVPGDSKEPPSAANRKPADGREPASTDNMEPVPADSREPASTDNMEPVPADSREPASPDDRHLWSPVTGEPALSETRDGSIFRGDSDAETDSRFRDQSFDEKGVEPAEEDVMRREPVLHLQSNDAPFEERSEVLPSGGSESGKETARLVKAENAEEHAGKIEDSGYYYYYYCYKTNLF